MNNLISEIHRKVKQWLIYGDEDLQMAQYAMTMRLPVPYRLVAYHAQQCAEKHLKAYLIFKRVDFPYTHNISRLLELCSQQASWPGQLQNAEELTPFAITTRYPGEDEEVTKEEAFRAIDIATYVRQVVRTALLEEGMELSNKYDNL
ncbi:MAG: HEPN domain-containing protein [bacterium]